MNIIRNQSCEEMTIEEFAEKHNLTMRVTRRPDRAGTDGEYYAHFDHADVKGNFLVGSIGNGATEGCAIADYARKISRQLLVLNAYGTNRREIRVPFLTDAPKSPTKKARRA